MASVWVPFTSESKEAIADYDEIRKEMKLALQECGRKLGLYLKRRQQMKREAEKRDVFERYIGEIAKACEALTGTEAKRVYDALLEQARKKTEFADAELDEEGKVIKEQSNGRLDDDEGVVILTTREPEPPGGVGRGGLRTAPESREEAEPGVEASKSVRGKRKPRSAATGGLHAAAPSKGASRSNSAAAVQRGSTSPEPGIKNKGKPKPRVRLGGTVESGLFG
jgi:hypothetical protein